MDLVRLKGTKILWTVHNLRSHEHLHPQLDTWFWKAFTQWLDGYISLSKVGMTAAQERFPRLKNLPGFVIPHGHYRKEYPDGVSSQQARALLKIPPSAKVLLFFSRIRSYNPKILNSGSALLVLSFGCSVLVPLQGALSELQTQVGQE